MPLNLIYDPISNTMLSSCFYKFECHWSEQPIYFFASIICSQGCPYRTCQQPVSNSVTSDSELKTVVLYSILSDHRPVSYSNCHLHKTDYSSLLFQWDMYTCNSKNKVCLRFKPWLVFFFFFFLSVFVWSGEGFNKFSVKFKTV